MRLILIALLLGVVPQDEPVTVARDAKQPHLAVDGDGRFYCAFLKGGNVMLSTSADDGATWSEPVMAIDAKGKGAGGMQRGPRVGVDAKGNVSVSAPLCFDEAEFSKRYPTAELWVAQSKDGGKTFGAPVQVNEVAKKAPESLHWMAVSGDGAVHAAWLDMREGGDRRQDLYYARVVDGKATKNLKIGSDVCQCCAPGLTVDGKGNPYVIWRDGKGTNRAIYMTFSKDGGKTFKAPMQVNSGETKVPN